MAHDVFISYAKEDQQFADVIHNRLRRIKIRCWIASQKEKLEPGPNWYGQIIHAIEESQVVVFILSHHSNLSPYVVRELGHAVEKGLDIITFRIKKVQPSDEIEFLIRGLQWLDAYPEPSEKHYKRLVEAIGRLLSRGIQKHPEEYEQELYTIEQLLLKHQWEACVSRCVEQFEKALRQLLIGLRASLVESGDRTKISAIQKIIEKNGVSSFEALQLTELVALYKETDIFSELRKQLTSSLKKVKDIDWDDVLCAATASWHQWNITQQRNNAEKMFQWLKILLYDCELAGNPLIVPPIPHKERVLQQCPECGQHFQQQWCYCPMCGISIIVTCESCHRRLEPDYKRCPYCEESVHRRPSRLSSDKDRARNEYRTLCKGAYLDGVVNMRERRLLEQKRLELGLSNEKAEEIERRCAPRNVWEFMRLVQGALVDGRIDNREQSFLKIKSQELDVDTDIANITIKVETAKRNGELF